MVNGNLKVPVPGFRSSTSPLLEVTLRVFTMRRFYLTPRPTPKLEDHPLSAVRDSNFFAGSKVASADSLTTHIRLQPSLKISGAIPPLNLSVSLPHIGTLFYLNILPMYISLNRSYPFWSYRGTLSIHHLPLTCTLHDTFISSSLDQLH